MLKGLLPCKIDYDGEYGIGTEEVDAEKAKEILPNIKDKEGNTLLHHATKYGCSRGTLNFLVENGVDINEKNKNGLAPIHIAAKYGHAHLIDFFIENKADINVQCGNFTKSEIDITEKNFINVQDGSEDESSVIDVKNDTTYKDASPISITVENNHENATGQLLSRGAKPNIGDYRGWAPIQIAIRTACNENCPEEEREQAYSIIEKLAVFFNGIHLSKKAETNEVIKTILENAMKSKDGNKLPTAPVDEYVPSAPPLDDDFYDKIGSYVKNIPELFLYPNILEELEELEENTIDSRDEEQSSEEKIASRLKNNDSLNKKSANEEFSKRINEFQKIAKSATSKGTLINLEVDDTIFYLEYSLDSVVDVTKIIDGAKSLGLCQELGANIVKIGESEVEIKVENGTRNYTDLSDNGDVIITFQISLGKLDVRLHNSIQHKDFIQVEVCNPERFNALIDIKEEMGKSCLFGRLSFYDAITQGGFKRSGKLQSSETISCKRSEPSEIVSLPSQDFKGDVEKIMEGISNTDISSSEKDSWVNRMQGKRTNEGCGRVM